MEIRHYSHIEWDELPRIELPSFALSKIGCRFTDRLSPGAYQIRGLNEAFRQCRFRLGHFGPSEDDRRDNHALLTSVDDGEFVIVHDGKWEYPMCSALRWCTENNPDGFCIPFPNDRISWLNLPSEGRWIADFRLPMLLHSHIERCLERGRRDVSCHRGLPERLWWDLWRRGRGEDGGGQGGSAGQGSAERPWYARAWDEARRVGEDAVEEVAETAKTAWEALPFTADEAATKAARERIVDSVAGTLDGMATLIGPSAEEILRAHETGDPDAIAMVEQRQQEQRDAAKALGEGVEKALGEVHERSGAAGVAGAVGATVAIGVAGGKGAGALGKAAGKLGGGRTPDVPHTDRDSVPVKSQKPQPDGYKTYRTHGITDDPRASEEGQRLMQHYTDRGFSKKEAFEKASELMETGSTPPLANPVEVGDRLYKVVPEGRMPGPNSEYWATREEIEALKGLDRDQIANRLGLPLESQQAPRFDVVEIKATHPATTFTSKIAPTTQNGWSQTGGGIQTLVTDRTAFTPPVNTGMKLP